MATQPARTPQAGHGPSTVAKVRILRIGIVQGGRIVEERLIRSRQNISIGWSNKATFSIPSEALTKEWMLFEVSPNDPVVFTGITALIAAIALLASWLPARRAAQIDPMRALRDE